MRVNPVSRLNRYLSGRSLSARVLWLIVVIILLVELLLMMPTMGRERQAWLWQRVTQANLVALSMSNAAAGTDEDYDRRDELLRMTGTEAIWLVEPSRMLVVLPFKMPSAPDRLVDLDSEGLLASIWQSDKLLLGAGGKRLLVQAASPLQKQAEVKVFVSAAALAAHLRGYVAQIAGLSIIVALVTGLLVFAALDRLLVGPMRIMTASIIGFRQDPEHAGQMDLSQLSRRDDEISEAARELALMQVDLRGALWRNARLAALGTAVAKISHDLRNILTSALLVADRLQMTADPVAKSAANTLIPAVERAAEMVSRTVDFAREGPPAITRSKVVLRDLADEAAAAILAAEPGVRIENNIPRELTLALDRTQIYRVLLNLLRNAAEAGAACIRIQVVGENGHTRLVVADDGPGLPQKILDHLFRPFSGSAKRGSTGLGLAIARDLIRAHGGDLLLNKTGPGGTEFVMTLSTTDVLVPAVAAGN